MFVQLGHAADSSLRRVALTRSFGRLPDEAILRATPKQMSLSIENNKHPNTNMKTKGEIYEHNHDQRRYANLFQRLG